MRPHFLGRSHSPAITLEEVTKTIDALATSPSTTENFFALASLTPQITANSGRYFAQDINHVTRVQDALLRKIFEKTELPATLIEIGRCRQSPRINPLNNRVVLADGALSLRHIEHNGVTLTTVVARRFWGLVQEPLLAFRTFQMGTRRGVEVQTLQAPHKLKPLQQSLGL